MTFKYEYMTLTQLGHLFGVSCQQIGKWLVPIGLRTEGNKPSNTAFQDGFVAKGPSRGDGYNWVWHSQRTVAALEQAGHRRIPNPPPNLVEPPKLNGPFTKRVNEANGYDIVNGDGSVCVVVTGDRNADFVIELLALADKHGLVARRLNSRQ
jgi:hypothetical protein